MKKLALISTYCDTEEKKEVLVQNLIELRSLGVDTLVLSPIPLGGDIFEYCDFLFYTKENPILNWPERSYSHWHKQELKTKSTVLHSFSIDYGWAALYQAKKLSQIGLSYDYDIYYHM